MPVLLMLSIVFVYNLRVGLIFQDRNNVVLISLFTVKDCSYTDSHCCRISIYFRAVNIKRPRLLTGINKGNYWGNRMQAVKGTAV